MDLEQMRIVIRAETSKLQKQLNNVKNNLNNVSNTTVKVDNNFKKMGEQGAKSFKKIVDSAKEFNKYIRDFSTYKAKYGIFGEGDEPFVKTVGELKQMLHDVNDELKGGKTLFADWFNGISDIQGGDFGLGTLTSSTYQAEDRVKMLDAALKELFADKKDEDTVRFTSGLLDLAVKSRQLKDDIDTLGRAIQQYKDIVNKGRMTPAEYGIFADFQKQYGSIENALNLFENLGRQYAATRGQIEEAIKEMNGGSLNVSAWGQFALTLGKVGIALKTIGNTAKKAITPVAKLTNKIGDMMAQYNPITNMVKSLGNSLHSLFTRVKRVLVYSTIVSFFRAVKNQIGDFLKQNTELMGALGKLKGAWITAFMPLYNYVVPKIIALINWLTVLAAKIATLMARIFGGSVKASKAQAKALTEEAKAAGGAADAYEAQLAAFDELNILQEDHSGGGGDGLELGEPDFDYDEGEMEDYLTWYDWLYDKTGKLLELHKELDKWLQKVAEKINWLSKNVLQMFRGDNQDMADAMIQRFKDLGRTLAEALNHFIEAINWNQLGQALGAGLDLAFYYLVAFVKTFNFNQLGQSIADALNGMIWQINWSNIGALLVSKWNAVWQFLAGFTKKIDWVSIGHAIADVLMSAIRSIDIVSLGSAIGNVLKGVFQLFIAFAKQFNAYEFAYTLFRKIVDALAQINWLQLGWDIIAGIAAGIWGAIQLAIGAIMGIIHGIIDAFTGFFMIGSPSKLMEEMGGYLIEGLALGISNAWEVLWTWFNEKFEALKQFCYETWENIHTTASTKWEEIKTTIGDKVNTLKDDAETKFNTMKDNLTTNATELKDALIEAWNLTKEGVGTALDGIKDAFSSAWSFIVDDTTGKFSTLVEKVAGAVKSIGSSIDSMLSKVASGISSAWSSISSFVSNALSRLASVSIPHFAGGGVITKPTVGLMGEYAGARTNPEIVTPESKMREVFNESTSQMVVLLDRANRLLTEIAEKDTSISIGDDTISASAARGAKNFKMRTGRNQFAM